MGRGWLGVAFQHAAKSLKLLIATGQNGTWIFCVMSLTFVRSALLTYFQEKAIFAQKRRQTPEF
jgi:hypothetical protein